jgi:hypothetical protein
MFVSSYQIHNVLNVYSKQLSLDRSVQKQESGNKNLPSDRISLSTEGKRRATIEKVAQDILSKITHYGSKGEIKTQGPVRSGDRAKGNVESDNKKETAFVFNVIDHLNKKTTNALSVKDTNFLIDRLEQMAKNRIEKDADR